MSSGNPAEKLKDSSSWTLCDWTVHPDANELVHESGQRVRVEARTMRVLEFLHERAGRVVTIEEMLERIWSGKVVTAHSVTSSIHELRKALGTGSTASRCIETISKRGYRLVPAQAEIAFGETPEPTPPRARPPWGLMAAICGAAAVLAVVSWVERSDSRRGSAPKAMDSSVTAQYVRARQLWSEREHEPTLQARDLLRDVIARDPEFAPAHAALADIYAHKTGADLGAPELETFREAQRELDTARAIDPDLPESYVTQALLDFYRDNQPRKGLESVGKALDKDAKFAYAWQTRAMLLSAVGEHDGSLEAIERARQLDPVSESIGWDEVWFLYLSGDYEKAHAAYERESQRHSPSYLYGALIEQGRGNTKEALGLWLKRLESRGAKLSNPSTIEGLAASGSTAPAYLELVRQVTQIDGYSESRVVLAVWQLQAGDRATAGSTISGITPDRSDWLGYWIGQMP